jgi:hypothetical protein
VLSGELCQVFADIYNSCELLLGYRENITEKGGGRGRTLITFWAERLESQILLILLAMSTLIGQNLRSGSFRLSEPRFAFGCGVCTTRALCQSYEAIPSGGPECDAPYCGVVRVARPASAHRHAGLHADIARRAALARRVVAHLSFPIVSKGAKTAADATRLFNVLPD